MAVIKQMKEIGKPTLAGKRIRAETMYMKGKEFMIASSLLRKHQGNTSFVQIYLLLQGIEILLKGVLLLEDYDKYNHKVLKSKYGHDIANLTNEVCKVYRIKNLNGDALSKLIKYNDWIHLKYEGLIDIFHLPESYQVDEINFKGLQTMRCIDKRFSITI